MPRLDIQRNDIVWVDFGPVRGNAKAGEHPAIVVQNEVGNRYSPMAIVVPLTDQRQFKNLPVQVKLTTEDTGLDNKDSCAECGHVTTIDRDTQIDEGRGVVGRVSDAAMERVDAALRTSLAL